MDIDIIFSNLEKADKVRDNFVVFDSYNVKFGTSSCKVDFATYSCEIYEDDVLLQRVYMSEEKYLELEDKCSKEIERRKLMRLVEFENQLKKIKG
jgi:predicted metal-binding transcription factor (methanogenesis marker protein 9)